METICRGGEFYPKILMNNNNKSNNNNNAVGKKKSHEFYFCRNYCKSFLLKAQNSMNAFHERIHPVDATSLHTANFRILFPVQLCTKFYSHPRFQTRVTMHRFCCHSIIYKESRKMQSKMHMKEASSHVCFPSCKVSIKTSRVSTMV